MIEEFAQERRSTSKILPGTSARESAVGAALGIVAQAVTLIKMFAEWRRKSGMENTLAQLIIPKKDDLERILRYETATDRSLTRALERLERLQARRRANVSRGSLPLDDSLPGDGKIAA